MNIKLQNLNGLMRNARTRTIIIFTGAILLFAVIIGLIRFFNAGNGSASQAQVRSTPTLQSVPGGFGRPETVEYARLQEQQNLLQSQAAARQGTSAIPTIIRASNFAGPEGASTCPNCCNCPGGSSGAGGTVSTSQSSSLAPNTLVYNAQGKVIGTLGPDGKVRNANGILVGTVGPDGLVRDANGNIIGSAGAAQSGAPVYDAQGRVIGKVGPDGQVRDANGNIIGTVGPDGLVRDANGTVIGKAAVTSSKAVPGTPVYDAAGRLIGTVGADGKVRDANGNVIGTVGPDGVVRDSNGNIIGKTGPTVPGKPVYDAQGRLVGIVGADGKMRDANGKVIGTLGLDNVVRDANGNILGNTTPAGTAIPTPPAATATLPSSLGGPQNAQVQSILQRQAQQVSTQRAEQLKQQLQGLMMGQANQLLAAWVSPVQQSVAGNPPQTSGVGVGVGSNGAGGLGGGGANGAPASVKAGTVMFGVLITSINSDQPGPVLATIVNGRFKGGRLVGSLTNQGDTILLSFNLLTLPNVSNSISINAVAIDENTARTSFSSRTDHHYWLRYGSLFAASFLQGYAQATLTSGTTVTSTGLATNTTTPDLSPSGKFMVALGNVGTRYSSVVGNVFNTPPTVYVDSGTAMGILFLTDVPALPSS